MTAVALERDPYLMAEQPQHTIAKILFVGSPLNFSTSLIAATGQNLGQIALPRLPSVAALRHAVEPDNTRPQIAVLDEPTMRGLTADDLTFMQTRPMLSLALAYSSPDYGAVCYRDMTRLQLRGIFPLDVRLDLWLSVITLIAHGGNYMCPKVVAAAPIELPSLHKIGLTQRQLDVLKLVAEGHSNRKIAEMLGLSVHTVKLHLHNVYLRLGARNRTEAAMRYRAMQS